jgi:ABC-type multidrug transport system ATPase subunit
LQLARVLFRKASFYVLDEPFSAVEQSVENAVMQFIKRMAIEKEAVFIIASHHMKMAQFAAVNLIFSADRVGRVFGPLQEAELRLLVESAKDRP